ncbi:hypothetical protein DNTS_009854 [Danionella cerebrum]|uniref:Uncharacterized protein n=1 Tax=Danionella cerebrum TaxID=2873325 RepID=A0A553NMC1_9TELE|nr:hypothetical protein DNTS_009854 [Danionella translucida]
MALKFLLGASVGLYCFKKTVDIENASIVRFGRAAVTTAVISMDYLTTLRHVHFGTEEYFAIKSKV